MALDIRTEREAARQLIRFLCRAAGVDHLNVRSIGVRIEPTSLPIWDIETIGGGERISNAIEEAIEDEPDKSSTARHS